MLAKHIVQPSFFILFTHALPSGKTTTCCYLIDGGNKGQKIVQMIANDRQVQHTKNKLDCLTAYKCPENLRAIIVTHPDQDHFGGVFGLLEYWNRKFTGDILITEDFSKKSTGKVLDSFLQQIKRSTGVKDPVFVTTDHLHNVFSERICCYFHDEAKGVLYSKTKVDGTHATRGEKSHGNDTSIITTVNGYDIVLTGDSSGGIIKKKLNWTSKAHTAVGIFQVPHHGSKNNSNEEFYKTFTASVYLISGGGHYEHPNGEVLQGIIKVNAERKTRCIILVTNSYGLRREKLDNLPEKWWEWVTIYHIDDLVNYRDTDSPRSKQYVTLDPALCLLPSPSQVKVSASSQPPQFDPHQIIDSNEESMVEWTPKGYVHMIKRKLNKWPPKPKESKEPLGFVWKNPLLYHFYQTLDVEITSEQGQSENKTIIMVPTPHQPWIGDTLSKCYVQMDCVKHKEDPYSIKFLEQHPEPNKWHRFTYSAPNGKQLWAKGNIETVKMHERKQQKQ